MNSVTQLRAMNEALKQSPEPIELIEIARKKVVGLIGNLRHRKKSEKEAQAAKESQVLQPSVQPDSNLYFRLDGADVRNIQPEYVNGGGSGKENRSFPYSTHPHLRQ